MLLKILLVLQENICVRVCFKESADLQPCEICEMFKNIPPAAASCDWSSIFSKGTGYISY